MTCSTPVGTKWMLNQTSATFCQPCSLLARFREKIYMRKQFSGDITAKLQYSKWPESEAGRWYCRQGSAATTASHRFPPSLSLCCATTINAVTPRRRERGQEAMGVGGSAQSEWPWLRLCGVCYTAAAAYLALREGFFCHWALCKAFGVTHMFPIKCTRRLESGDAVLIASHAFSMGESRRNVVQTVSISRR